MHDMQTIVTDVCLSVMQLNLQRVRGLFGVSFAKLLWPLVGYWYIAWQSRTQQKKAKCGWSAFN